MRQIEKKTTTKKKQAVRRLRLKATGFAQSAGLKYSLLLIPFLITGPQSLGEVNL